MCLLVDQHTYENQLVDRVDESDAPKHLDNMVPLALSWSTLASFHQTLFLAVALTLRRVTLQSIKMEQASKELTSLVMLA